jgi:hypothetical protein
MGKLLGIATQTSDYHEILTMKWATAHPYLHTLIEVANPTLYVVIIFAGLKVIGSMKRGTRR